jgi:hypothetical protein
VQYYDYKRESVMGLRRRIEERIQRRNNTWRPRGGEIVVHANLVDISELRADNVPGPDKVIDDVVGKSPHRDEVYGLIGAIAGKRAIGENVSDLETQYFSLLDAIGREAGRPEGPILDVSEGGSSEAH